MAGSTLPNKPLWLLAELTYACPLQCPYCSNPVNFAHHKTELDTEAWLKVLKEARALGATQLGFSGGEPTVRRDLEILITEARKMGYYTNLITSGVGLKPERIAAFKAAGLDHIQVSFQAHTESLNDYLAGTTAFQHKRHIAQEVKKQGYPMVLCFVLHRQNTDHIAEILDMAAELSADYVELATTQYYGWALLNREHLLPTKAQLLRAEPIAHAYQAKFKGKMKIYYVVPDYHEGRPKACMNGWGNIFLTIAPDGTALPCHSARELPNINFPNVQSHDLQWIWEKSPAFQHFRGDEWMKEPCRTCPEKTKDFGGCRCQAYLLTGDAANADPVCTLSPHHEVVLNAIAQPISTPLIFRNPLNSKKLTGTKNDICQS